MSNERTAKDNDSNGECIPFGSFSVNDWWEIWNEIFCYGL
jgi:hypothetical protein